MTEPVSGPGVDLGALERVLLDAHSRDDRPALARHYAEAAQHAQRAGQPDREAFFLTHAYVFALSAGDPACDALHARLKALGREE